MNLVESYHTLIDSSNGTEKPWAEKKLKSHVVESSYLRLGMDKRAERMAKCGSFLEFKLFSDESLKLHYANFCRIRLCPMCAWRRSLKIFGQVSKVMEVATKDPKNEFLFLTLTVRNVDGSELSEAITRVLDGYTELLRITKVKKAVKGAFRALEVTRNTDDKSESFGTYHPHLHCILMVDSAYFKHHYIKQSEWVDLWQQCIDSDYKPIIDVHKVRPKYKRGESSLVGAVCEVSKYTVKDGDYISDDIEWTDETISVLDPALEGRRLVSFRGELKTIAKNLKLDDMVDGDLINTDNEEQINKDLEYVILRYGWSLGYRQYRLEEVHRPDPDGAPIYDGLPSTDPIGY